MQSHNKIICNLHLFIHVKINGVLDKILERFAYFINYLLFKTESIIAWATSLIVLRFAILYC